MSVTDPGFRYDYPNVVRFELPERSFSSYQRAADFINLSHADLLCIQHEFGIYGGPSGSHLLHLMRRLRLPVVTTLHTVLEDTSSDQRRVMEEILQRSEALVVMSERSRRILQTTYQLAPEKIELIPHGIPDQPFVDPNFYKDQYGVAGRPMTLTFGLLSPGKGIEYGIQALPSILAHHPDLVYVILGATHPNLVRAEGETYRLSLERQTSISRPISIPPRSPPAPWPIAMAPARRWSAHRIGTPRNCWRRGGACSCHSGMGRRLPPR